jgi:uncharacterized membrane protein
MLNFLFDRYKNLEFSSKGGRIEALDLYRFIAIVLMIQGHAINELALPSYIDLANPFWNIWGLVRGLTAPVFMLISGAVNIFANKRDENGLVRKDLIIKRLRTSLLLLFTAYLMVFPMSSLKHLNSFDGSFWLNFWQTNILHVVALCLITLQIGFAFTKSNKSMMRYGLVLGLFSAISAWFVQMIDWYSFMPGFLAPYLSFKFGSIYTLFPVSSYFFFGSAIGAYLKDKQPSEMFDVVFKKGVKFGLLLIAIGAPIFYLLENAYYPYTLTVRVNPGVVALRIGIVMTLFPAIVLLHEKVKALSWVYLTLSKKSLFLFVIHLLVIYGSSCFPGIATYWGRQLTGVSLLISAIVVELSSMFIAYYYDRSVKIIPSVRYAYLSVIVVLVLMLNILY